MNRLTDHLETVNETYIEHLLHAARFSLKLFVGSVACLLHAIFPFLFVKTGSKLINGLHHDMVTHRSEMSAKANTSETV
ncbi:MAG: hypothetical protein ACI9J2_001051 [Saprospiraceae bacterium]|jgi:hypothetical protein